MIDFDFEDSLSQIFKNTIDNFLDSFKSNDNEKLHELEGKSKEIIDILKARSGVSFEDIVRNNDIKSFQDYINKNDPEQIFSKDDNYGTIFILRLISLFIQISKETQEKEKIAQYLHHYLLKINNIFNLKHRIQLKSLLKQINEIFSIETEEHSQELIQTAQELLKKLSC